MKKGIHISAHFDQPDLVQHLVERLAYKRNDTGYADQKMPNGFTAVETSSTETYVSGTLSIKFKNEAAVINMPFIISFLFTCIKGKAEPFQLIWSASLS